MIVFEVCFVLKCLDDFFMLIYIFGIMGDLKGVMLDYVNLVY